MSTVGNHDRRCKDVVGSLHHRFRSNNYFNLQELSHQLSAALNEVQAAMNNQKQTVAPWLVRTLGKEYKFIHIYTLYVHSS